MLGITHYAAVDFDSSCENCFARGGLRDARPKRDNTRSSVIIFFDFMEAIKWGRYPYREAYHSMSYSFGAQ